MFKTLLILGTLVAAGSGVNQIYHKVATSINAATVASQTAPRPTFQHTQPAPSTHHVTTQKQRAYYFATHKTVTQLHVNATINNVNQTSAPATRADTSIPYGQRDPVHMDFPSAPSQNVRYIDGTTLGETFNGAASKPWIKHP